VKEYISVKALRNSQDIFQVILRSEYWTIRTLQAEDSASFR
jgi:hypothetical protein